MRALVPSFCALLFIASAAPSLATTIHAGDSVNITVWNHPELSKVAAVDADGNVRVPLSGQVNIGGLDEEAAAKKVAAALLVYVQHAAVSIEDTLQGTSVFVAGGPIGVLKYQQGETLSTAIADEFAPVSVSTTSLNDAGQSTSKANDSNAQLRGRIDLHVVKIVRDGTEVGVYDVATLNAQGDPGPALEPGDHIVFRFKPIQVHVMGDVTQPGIAYLSPDESMADAISESGGILPTASSNHLTLVRGGETFSLALGDPLFSAPAQMGDMITVPAAPRVTVVGMVANPGVVSLRTDSTLLSAVYTAGGPQRFANLKGVEVMRNGTKTSYDIVALTHGDESQNPVLHDGDTVLVPRSHGIDFEPFFGILGGFANHVPL
jgi:protein involved in polysaccharide export with SLBB domain